ncbi:CHRD domain-containing protein [Thermoactinospora rubra]|uniref:CHRD domain-containing protein n=1 Tax=Thermoactinospora rubra TaxID=1088767 RepID=UPI000A12042A|nr:CHRD domain-containing protein [Thermoactinospora rubra]
MLKALIVIPALAAAAAVFPGMASASHTPSYRFVEMTGEQEVPGPGDPDGVGIFAKTVKDGRLCYVITAHNIQPATAAHIHEGERGEAGPIVVALKAPSEGFANDCIQPVKSQTAENADTTLTFEEFRAILENPSRYYANVHNEEFPDGAIRGQLG